MIEKSISTERMEHVIEVFGSFDENLRLIEDELHVKVTDRDSELKLSGEAENDGVFSLWKGQRPKRFAPLRLVSRT